MLVQFLDESGIHDQENGQLIRLGVGGGMARCETWEALHYQWDFILKQDHWPSKINWFHYKDWRNREGEFESWEAGPRFDLFDQLVKLIGKSVMDFVCTSVPVDQNDENKTQSTYIKAVTDIIHKAELTSGLSSSNDEKITLVFATHPELAPIRITNYVDKLKQAIPRIADCVISDPRDRPELQIADVLAYELTRSYYPDMIWGKHFNVIRKVSDTMQQIDHFGAHGHFVRHLE